MAWIANNMIPNGIPPAIGTHIKLDIGIGCDPIMITEMKINTMYIYNITLNIVGLCILFTSLYLFSVNNEI